MKTQCNRFRSVRLVTLLLTLAGGTCFAQFNASIQGIVQDPTGGVVPKATVTLLNEATEVTATAITDTSGIYHFVSLPPGRYRISAVAQGFEKTQVEASRNKRARETFPRRARRARHYGAVLQGASQARAAADFSCFLSGTGAADASLGPAASSVYRDCERSNGDNLLLPRPAATRASVKSKVSDQDARRDLPAQSQSLLAAVRDFCLLFLVDLGCT